MRQTDLKKTESPKWKEKNPKSKEKGEYSLPSSKEVSWNRRAGVVDEKIIPAFKIDHGRLNWTFLH